ncbi:hypothetical protein L1987_13564 [Smallanthus sonchifolius]|uniref:Uncharacterized protein n=1 Tax=Smallanthus sonchifolius TaxID=185202 RepID=A0ACB9JJ07_9ASTR|nr:hypothetical protein L1987_13564 [Smallanthus sonchifolius]
MFIPPVSISSSTLEDFCVELLPFSTPLHPRIPDLITSAQEVPSTSQSEDLSTLQENGSGDTVVDQASVDNSTNASTDQLPIVDPLIPVTKENLSSHEAILDHHLSNQLVHTELYSDPRSRILSGVERWEELLGGKPDEKLVEEEEEEVEKPVNEEEKVGENDDHKNNDDGDGDSSDGGNGGSAGDGDGAGGADGNSGDSSDDGRNGGDTGGNTGGDGDDGGDSSGGGDSEIEWSKSDGEELVSEADSKNPLLSMRKIKQMRR